MAPELYITCPHRYIRVVIYTFPCGDLCAEAPLRFTDEQLNQLPDQCRFETLGRHTLCTVACASYSSTRAPGQI